jgi:cytidyltransferase-like protein
MKTVVVTGSFDNLTSHHVRLLEEAARLGRVRALLWSDEAVRQREGHLPRFPEQERLYVLNAIRYVSRVSLVSELAGGDAIPDVAALSPDVWAMGVEDDSLKRRSFCAASRVVCRTFTPAALQGFPELGDQEVQAAAGQRKAVVTGCFDWLHSGHVRFFEEVSGLGDLYVVVGHDANVRRLKGEGHPLFPQEQRRYMVQAVRYVTRALVSSGHGWMDAEPEIAWLKPDLYVVNEDGDKPEKREFCRARGIEYVVLKRLPKEGLPRRRSTDLRGF